MKLLAIDPSGSFDTGKGITGYSIYNLNKQTLLTVGQIRAEDFEQKGDYYKEHLKLVEKIKPNLIVIEEFTLYPSKASSFYNKELETSQLIGEIEGYARINKIEVIKQRASNIKGALYKPNVLLKAINNQIEHNNLGKRMKKNQWKFKGKVISNHIVDSIRHAAYYFNKINREKKEELK